MYNCLTDKEIKMLEIECDIQLETFINHVFEKHVNPLQTFDVYDADSTFHHITKELESLGYSNIVYTRHVFSGTFYYKPNSDNRDGMLTLFNIDIHRSKGKKNHGYFRSYCDYHYKNFEIIQSKLRNTSVKDIFRLTIEQSCKLREQSDNNINKFIELLKENDIVLDRFLYIMSKWKELSEVQQQQILNKKDV